MIIAITTIIRASITYPVTFFALLKKVDIYVIVKGEEEKDFSP